MFQCFNINAEDIKKNDISMGQKTVDKVSDSTVIDTTKKELTYLDRRNKINSVVFAAMVVPGMGQAYNKKYWKMPIVYAGFGALGYSVKYNKTNYNKYLNEYVARVDSDPNTIPNPDYEHASTEQIIAVKDNYKRNLTLSVMGIVLLYTVQVIDAYVDAELNNFEVSDDLTLNVSPVIQQSSGNGFNSSTTYQPGFSFCFKFK